MTHYLSSDALDAIERDYPSGDAFLRRYQGMGRDELRALQAERFRTALATAWQTPFYRRVWGAEGIEEGDVRSLDDLNLLPVIDKTTIMDDVARHPPFGSMGTRLDGAARGQVLQTTSGTTGSPQPILWGAHGREAQNALLGRAYRWLGVGSDDIVHSVYGHGPVNGGHYIREAVNRYTDALLLSAGTGAETRSEQQVALMSQFGVTVLAGFADYLRRLAAVAREVGLEPGRDIPVRLVVGHLPQGTRELVEQDWPGARAFDWYGIADTGIVSAEGPDRSGQWLWEDANVVELLDPDTGAAVADGQEGDLVLTSLCKNDVAPLIRFNSHDVTRIRTDAPGADLPFRRTDGLVGRSDQMVKLRGINVYPTAIASLLPDVPGVTGEYFCRLERRADGAEHLVVVVESGSAEVLAASLEEALTQRLGVRVGVELVAVGSTADITGVASRQKPLRLVDAR